ncbi:CbiG protein/precorrin-3B C17-methyltransferase, partial [Pseudomonas syringae pv. actinidiae ICMP 19096]
PQAELAIHVGCALREPAANELLIYPRSVLVAVSEITAELAAHVRTALRDSNIAEQSLACLLASEEQMANAL